VTGSIGVSTTALIGIQASGASAVTGGARPDRVARFAGAALATLTLRGWAMVLTRRLIGIRHGRICIGRGLAVKGTQKSSHGNQ